MDLKDTFGESKFIADGLKENYRFEMPDWFWDKMGSKISLKESSKNYSYYDYEKNELYITKTWGGIERTNLMIRSTLIHELGHAYHFNTKLLNFENVSIEVKEFYKEAKSYFDILPDKKLFWLRKEHRFVNILALQEEYQGIYTDDEISRLFVVVGGIFEAISNGKIGFGHTSDYFKDAYLKFMELFANSTDIYFNGNQIIANLFPEFNRLIINFWDNEKRSIKTN